MFTMPHKNSPLVAVVGCSAIKAGAPVMARNFYQSPLFKAALAYAEVRTKHIAIASAKYGAVKLDDVLEPYDFKLSELRKTDREDWGARTIQELVSMSKVTLLSPPPIFLLLCGEVYSDALLHGAHWHNLPRPEIPMARMKGVGNRIRWLKEERSRLGALAQP